jgi:preprotein translocase subunit YajC
MNLKKFLTLSLTLIMIFMLALNSIQAEPQKKDKKDQKKEEKTPIYIPPEVKVLIQQGINGRIARVDVPFTIIPNLFLPAKTNIYVIFYFRAKNTGLLFTPSAPQQANQSENAQTTSEIKTKFHVFAQFNKIENNKTSVFKETYIPVELKWDAASFDPEAESLFSFSYPLPPGKYLLALAVASPDLKKVGINYHEFALPDADVLYKEKRLETTPLFLVKKIEEMQAVENVVQLHQDFFTWSILKIYPDFVAKLKPGDTADILFFIYGARPDEQQKFSVEVNYEVTKGEEPNPVLRWASRTYETPFIEQPLPLVKTLLIKDEKGERQEQKPLEPGSYNLVIKITDKITGLHTEQKLPFEIVE